MPVLSGLTDDEIALLGCLAALAVCGGLMSLSYYLRPRSARHVEEEPAGTIPFRRREETAEDEDVRRAA